MRAAPKEKHPAGGVRWKRRLRVSGPYLPRIAVRKTCLVCAKNLCKGRFFHIGRALVHKEDGWILTYGAILCHGHTEVYLHAPCQACGHELYAVRGPRLVRDRLVEQAEYVTRAGEVVRECPSCSEVLR